MIFICFFFNTPFKSEKTLGHWKKHYLSIIFLMDTTTPYYIKLPTFFPLSQKNTCSQFFSELLSNANHRISLRCIFSITIFHSKLTNKSFCISNSSRDGEPIRRKYSDRKVDSPLSCTSGEQITRLQWPPHVCAYHRLRPHVKDSVVVLIIPVTRLHCHHKHPSQQLSDFVLRMHLYSCELFYWKLPHASNRVPSYLKLTNICPTAFQCN